MEYHREPERRRERTIKDGRSRSENVATQPLVTHRVFNNPLVLPEAWYPVCPSRELKRGRARSFRIGAQRLVLYRGTDGVVRARDAFCPHMGADLGNGTVEGTSLRCYFHQWRFDSEGALDDLPCGKSAGAAPALRCYPTEEKYGFLWVYSAAQAPYGVVAPAGLDTESRLSSVRILTRTLHAHHHVMMANGIDLQHFRAVHKLDIDFQFEVKPRHPQVFDWELEGAIPRRGFRAKLARWLLGERLGYSARFAGGSLVAVTYGPNQRFRGTGRKLPALHLLWGCEPLESGVSRVHVFLVTAKRKGIAGWLVERAVFAAAFALLLLLKDDDAKAFPNMRFNTAGFIDADRSVAQLVKLINGLPLSRWAGRGERSH